MSAAVSTDVGSSGPVAPERPSLHRRLFSNAFWSLGGRLISMGSVLAANMLLARYLSTDDLSAYAVAAATVALMAMPAAFGAPRVVLRVIREAVVAHTPQRAFDSLSGCIRLVLVVSAILAGTLILAVQWLGAEPKWDAVRGYPVLIGAWFGLSAIGMCLAHALQGFDDFYSAALVGARNGGIISNLLFLIALAAAGATGRLTLSFALSAQVFLYLAALLYAVYVLRGIRMRTASIANIEPFQRPSASSRASWFFAESWPVLVIQLTSLGVAQIDLLMVAWLTNEEQIASYNAVARLCEILAAGQIMAAGIAAPFVSELYAANEMGKLERMLRGIASFSAAPTIVLGAVMLMAPAAVLQHTFGDKFVDGATALQIGVIGCCIAGLTGPNSLTLIMAGQQRILMRISALASIAYLLLAPWMISTWGIVGAAAATTVVFGGYNILVTLMIKARLGIWTIASLSPSDYVAAFRQVFKRRSAAPVD